MPRTARQSSETAIYHVIIRGINQQPIFDDDADRQKFIEILRQVKTVSEFKLYAFCLMGNHVHLLIEEAGERLSQVLKRIGSRYAGWFNWKYQRQGHLFQDRFKSEPVTDDSYFSTVLSYIHLNPVKAGLCKQAKDYAWSSMGLLQRRDSLVNWEDLSKLLAFGGELNEESLANPAVLKATDTLPMDFEAHQIRCTDAQAVELMVEICGEKTAAGFQKLDAPAQRRAYAALAAKGLSIRQIARITGSSKGVVERWRKSD
ncbi:MAG: transposase [Coriobacteriales bacterium]|jgi:REP element-mobilizing transposase RayT|nr:transposase [Coriobacteriales bacterium]